MCKRCKVHSNGLVFSINREIIYHLFFFMWIALIGGSYLRLHSILLLENNFVRHPDDEEPTVAGGVGALHLSRVDRRRARMTMRAKRRYKGKAEEEKSRW